MNMIQNPILPGFNPDPSIIRVGDDYYIATSTFEWYPGVQIHHSKDLINWELIARPLNRLSQLDLRGTLNNYGVWAPCLSYDDGIFYLTYSNVRYMNNELRDCHNYIVTTTDIRGEWSEPIYLKSNHADFSLFHDTDGKKWLVFPWDCADNGVDGRCIAVQEYSAEIQKPIGPIIGIFKGTSLGTAEGPHLYHINGYYYLFTAEGGTGYGHAETVARSKSLLGNYEVCPHNPVLTSRFSPFSKLQKAGHADLVQTQNGEWYMVHLCARPLPHSIYCILGRETAIQKIKWTKDGWPKLITGKKKPQLQVEAPKLPICELDKPIQKDDFDSETLSIQYQTPRIKLEEDSLSLTERPGFLRLKGKESLSSIYNNVLVARRQQAFCYTATTCLEFNPENTLQSAGLTCYYNTYSYHYVYVTYDKKFGKCISVMTCKKDNISYQKQKVCIEGWGKCYLRANMNYKKLQFQYSENGKDWKNIGSVLNSSILSDEFKYYGMMNFTGAFVGLCCQDLGGSKLHADFDFFEYIESENL